MRNIYFGISKHIKNENDIIDNITLYAPVLSYIYNQLSITKWSHICQGFPSGSWKVWICNKELQKEYTTSFDQKVVHQSPCY